MSEKKSARLAVEEDPVAEIEIVTMGIKTAAAEHPHSPLKDKEHQAAPNPAIELTPNQHDIAIQFDWKDERPALHSSPGVGDLSGEEKIREHVEEIMRKELL